MLLALPLLAALLTTSKAAAQPAAAAIGPRATIAVSTDAARYRPGAPVTLTLRIADPTKVPVAGATLTVDVRHLATSVATSTLRGIGIAADGSAERTLSLLPPDADHQGYLVQASLRARSGTLLGVGWTAVDVSSDASTFPRYGFVSRYDDGVDLQAVIRSLDGYHLDDVQFYDWEHASHVPLAGTPGAPASSWQDIAGRTNERRVVLGLIDGSHSIGADTYAYNTLYNAWAGYARDGSGVDPAWGLYRDRACSDPVGFGLPGGWSTTGLDVFDPADPGWRSYILRREQDVFTAYPFDGWQVDQLGDQGAVYTCAGAPVDLAGSFDGFLNAAADGLGKKLVFNAVGQYGQQPGAANPNLSFLYTEAWPGTGQSTYDDLAQVIAQNDAWSKGTKKSVLAAYLDQSLCTSAGGMFDAPGVLLADAVVFAHGGDHLELGDVDHMLCAPYFPNTDLQLSAGLRQALHHYYDFLVAYENLLRDGQRPVSRRIALSGLRASSNGSAHAVWTFAASAGGTDVLHFVNLLRNPDSSWGDTYGADPVPPLERNVHVRYCAGHGVPGAASLASPDVDGGMPSRLSFSRDGGGCIRFVLPELRYWDMVWISTGPAT